MNNGVSKNIMKNLGKFETISLIKETLIPLDSLKPGFNNSWNHIIEVNSN